MQQPKLFNPKIHYDERGFFLESFRQEDFCGENFVQENHSYSHANVLRGLHFQKGQAKLVRVISGRVLDVAIDFRKELQTYLKVYYFELDGKNQKQVLIPDGFLHGFYAFEPTHLVYKVTSYYDPKLEGGINPFDAELNIAWPDEGKKIVSKKDQELPLLKEFKSCL